ncbi:transposase [Streptomyces termitum]|uniref:transposase n=1 Tax=Streptomyces termitum TaxID=67368 RepID=UPI0037A6FE26
MDDTLWALSEPLLPPWPERAPGPRPVPDRLCLKGTLYVLHNGLAWQLLPLELGFGSGQTRRRRLERWQQAGVFDRLPPEPARRAERGRRAGLVPGMRRRLPCPGEKGAPTPARRRSTGDGRAASTT